MNICAILVAFLPSKIMIPESGRNIGKNIQIGARIVGENAEVLVDRIRTVNLRKLSKRTDFKKVVLVGIGGFTATVVAREGVRRFKNKKNQHQVDRIEDVMLLPAPKKIDDPTGKDQEGIKELVAKKQDSARKDFDMEYPEPPIVDRDILNGVKNKQVWEAELPEDKKQKLDEFLEQEGVDLNDLSQKQKWETADRIIDEDKFFKYLEEVAKKVRSRMEKDGYPYKDPKLENDTYGLENNLKALDSLLENQQEMSEDEFRSSVKLKINRIENAYLREYGINQVAEKFGVDWKNLQKEPGELLVSNIFENFEDTESEAQRYQDEIVSKNCYSEIDYRQRVKLVIELSKIPLTEKSKDRNKGISSFVELESLDYQLGRFALDQNDPLVEIRQNLRTAGRLKADEIMNGKGKKPKEEKGKNEAKKERKSPRKEGMSNKKKGLIGLGGVIAVIAATAYAASECTDKNITDFTQFGAESTRIIEPNLTPNVGDVALISGQLKQRDAFNSLDRADGVIDGRLTLKIQQGEDFRDSVARTLGEVAVLDDHDIDSYTKFMQYQMNADLSDTQPGEEYVLSSDQLHRDAYILREAELPLTNDEIVHLEDIGVKKDTAVRIQWPKKIIEESEREADKIADFVDKLETGELQNSLADNPEKIVAVDREQMSGSSVLSETQKVQVAKVLEDFGDEGANDTEVKTDKTYRDIKGFDSLVLVREVDVSQLRENIPMPTLGGIRSEEIANGWFSYDTNSDDDEVTSLIAAA